MPWMPSGDEARNEAGPGPAVDARGWTIDGRRLRGRRRHSCCSGRGGGDDGRDRPQR